MSNRIDYAYNAQERVKLAIESRRPASEVTAIAQIAAAEATLALVEQQRIANLIALSVNAARMVAEGTASLGDYLALHAKVDLMIREGLGL